MIAKDVGHCNFKQFALIATTLCCRPYKFKDFVGDNVYDKQEFHLNGWRFVCDNVRLFIAQPKD